MSESEEMESAPVVHLTFNAIARAVGRFRSMSHEEIDATAWRLACTWGPEQWRESVAVVRCNNVGDVTCPTCLILLDEALSVTEGA